LIYTFSYGKTSIADGNTAGDITHDVPLRFRLSGSGIDDGIPRYSRSLTTSVTHMGGTISFLVFGFRSDLVNEYPSILIQNMNQLVLSPRDPNSFCDPTHPMTYVPIIGNIINPRWAISGRFNHQEFVDQTY
jgi:hypothetical protein